MAKKFDDVAPYQSAYLDFLRHHCGMSGEVTGDYLLWKTADFAELVAFVRQEHIPNYARLIDRILKQRPELLDTAVNQYPAEIMKYIENNY